MGECITCRNSVKYTGKGCPHTECGDSGDWYRQIPNTFIVGQDSPTNQLGTSLSSPGMCNPQPSNQTDLQTEINKSCEEIKTLFAYKNSEYGLKQDPFANFRKTAERIIIPFMESRGVTVTVKDAMYLVLSIYVDKHAVALSQTGLNGNEVAERLGDIANYSLIAKAMLKMEV